MIDLIDICNEIERLLNSDTQGYTYRINSDASTHQIPEREGNTVTNVIEGIAQIISSSIVPVQGLKIGTQSIYIEFAIPLDTKEIELENGYANIINAYKQDINAIVSEPRINTISGFVTTMTGTLAEVGEPEQSSSVGLMIPISFTIELNYFLNGYNSMQESLSYNTTGSRYEDIPYTSMSIARVVNQDGGAFSNTSGTVKNYIQNTALSIELTVPAISDNAFCLRFRRFLLSAENDSFKIRYKNKVTNVTKDYTMIFLTSNSQSQGADNVGYTITLAEAL